MMTDDSVMGRYGTETQRKGPPAPEVELHASSPQGDSSRVGIPAILDTGAACTGLPRWAIEKLKLRNYTEKRFRSALHEGVEYKRMYLLDLRLGSTDFEAVEVAQLERDYAVIGRDILNRWHIRFNAPLGIWAIEVGQAP